MALSNAALTTVARAQAIVGTGIDTTRLEGVIEAVSKAAARWTGLTWEYSASVTDWVQGNDQQLIWLPRRNIDSITSIYIGGSEQTVALLSSVNPGTLVSTTVYRTDDTDEQGALWRQSGWPISSTAWGDLTRHPNLSPNKRALNIRVVYAGGYVTPAQAENEALARDLPYDVEEAILREVAYQITRPVDGLVSERTPGGWSQSWGRPTGASNSLLSSDTQMALRAYRREWF